MSMPVSHTSVVTMCYQTFRFLLTWQVKSRIKAVLICISIIIRKANCLFIHLKVIYCLILEVFIHDLEKGARAAVGWRYTHACVKRDGKRRTQKSLQKVTDSLQRETFTKDRNRRKEKEGGWDREALVASKQ